MSPCCDLVWSGLRQIGLSPVSVYVEKPAERPILLPHTRPRPGFQLGLGTAGWQRWLELRTSGRSFPHPSASVKRYPRCRSASRLLHRRACPLITADVSPPVRRPESKLPSPPCRCAGRNRSCHRLPVPQMLHPTTFSSSLPPYHVLPIFSEIWD